MYQDYQAYENKVWKRVTARVAQKMFNMGRPVLLLPVRVSFSNPWITPLKVTQNTSEVFSVVTEAYAASNCNTELGRYCKYYVVS